MTPIEALQFRAETTPNGVAFIAGNETWTYQRLAAQAERLARGFARRGVREGDRIALHMANRPELAVALFACFAIGAIAVPINNRFKTAELTSFLGRIRPALYLGDAGLYSQAAPIDPSILPHERRFVAGIVGDGLRVQSVADLPSDVPATVTPMSDGGSPAVLLATSGTTGIAKFVIHTSATLGAAIELFGQLELEDGNQTAIVTCPMVHASGFFSFFTCLRFGAPMILLERFDADAVLDAIELHRGSWMLGLPFMFAAMLERQRMRSRDVESLRFCVSGGDVCPSRLQQAFPLEFGVPLHSLWAATEAPGSLTYGLEPGPVTRVARGAQVRLVDDAGKPVLPGEVGELEVRGANVSVGYWAGPDAIEGAPEDGWYQTGDLMRQDEKGDLWFVSRKKDLIIRGGSNIWPVEIERVLAAHPAVKDAAVVGMPDETLGQRVAGFVQLANGASLEIVSEVLDVVRHQLADYKVPERLQVVPAIPRNALGKTDRKALLALIASGKARERPSITARTGLMRSTSRRSTA